MASEEAGEGVVGHPTSLRHVAAFRCATRRRRPWTPRRRRRRGRRSSGSGWPTTTTTDPGRYRLHGGPLRVEHGSVAAFARPTLESSSCRCLAGVNTVGHGLGDRRPSRRSASGSPTATVLARAASRSRYSTIPTADGAALDGIRLVRCRAMSARSQVADSSWTRRNASRISASRPGRRRRWCTSRSVSRSTVTRPLEPLSWSRASSPGLSTNPLSRHRQHRRSLALHRHFSLSTCAASTQIPRTITSPSCRRHAEPLGQLGPEAAS